MITNKKNNKLKVLSVFDFDGTLTYYDSFILFLYFTFGKRNFIKKIMHIILPMLFYICRYITRNDLKGILIRIFLTNVDEFWFRQKAESFCRKYWTKLMRPTGILAVQEEVNSGAEVTLCSASPTILLQPFAARLNIKFIGTQLEIQDGKLTGNIIGKNCRCKQKIVQLQAIYGDLSVYYLRVWGDTRGDYELLAIAQDPHWKFFHKFKVFSNILSKI